MQPGPRHRLLLAASAMTMASGAAFALLSPSPLPPPSSLLAPLLSSSSPHHPAKNDEQMIQPRYSRSSRDPPRHDSNVVKSDEDVSHAVSPRLRNPTPSGQRRRTTALSFATVKLDDVYKRFGLVEDQIATDSGGSSPQERESMIGSGAYGHVLACKEHPTEKEVAVKIVNKQFTKNSDLQREVQALRENRMHPNIVTLFDVLDCAEAQSWLLVMEKLSGGEVFERIVKNGPFFERAAAELVLQVASAIRSMHQLDWAHLDIKPENLVFVRKGDVSLLKVIDFGMARRLSTLAHTFEEDDASEEGDDGDDDDDDTLDILEEIRRLRVNSGRIRPDSGDDDEKAKTKRRRRRRKKTKKNDDDDDDEDACDIMDVGTTVFWSPEMIACLRPASATSKTEGKNKERVKCPPIDGRASDLWAIGVLTYIMLLGCHPFDRAGDASDEVIAERAKLGSLPSSYLRFDVHGDRLVISPAAQDFIKRLLDPDPSKRMTMEQLFAHEWIVRNDAADAEMNRTARDAGEGHTNDILRSADFHVYGKDAKLKTAVVSATLRTILELEARRTAMNDKEEEAVAVSSLFVEKGGRKNRPESGDADDGSINVEVIARVNNKPRLDPRTEEKLFVKTFKSNVREEIEALGEEGVVVTDSNSKNVLKQNEVPAPRSSPPLEAEDVIKAVDHLVDRTPMRNDGKAETSRNDATSSNSSDSPERKRPREDEEDDDDEDDSEEVKRIFSKLVRRYDKGEAVFNVGDAVNGMFVIKRGRVQLMYGKQAAQELGPGDFFGESAVLDGRRVRNASVKCLEDDCQIMFLPSNEVITLLSAVREWRERLDEISHRRYRLRSVKVIEKLLGDKLPAPRVYEPGDIVFRRGDESHSLFLVKRGLLQSTVPLESRGLGSSGKESEKSLLRRALERTGLNTRGISDVVVLSEWRSGDVFGISTLFGADSKRMATARAVSRCELIEVPREVLEKMLSAEPSLRENLGRQFRRFKEKAEVTEEE